MANLTIRGNYWYVRGVVDLPDGGSEYVNLSTRVRVDEKGSAKRAAEVRVRILAQVRSGEIGGKRDEGDLAEATVRDGVRMFLRQRELGDTSQGALSRWVRHMGSTRLRDLTIGMLDAYGEAQDWSPQTLRREMVTIRSCLNHLRDKDYPVPELRFRLPAQEALVPRRWLDREEWEDFMEAAREVVPDFEAIFTFMRFTGCRPGEARELKWDDVFEKRGPDGEMAPYVTLRSTKGRGGVRTRTLKLAQPVLDVLPERPRRARGKHVFLWEGRPISKDLLFDRWVEAREEAGLDSEVTPYTARHSFASLLVQMGTPDLTVANLMGHADTQMLARYAHLRPEDYDSAVDRLV